MIWTKQKMIEKSKWYNDEQIIRTIQGELINNPPSILAMDMDDWISKKL
jgi:hypothetical protein